MTQRTPTAPRPLLARHRQVFLAWRLASPCCDSFRYPCKPAAVGALARQSGTVTYRRAWIKARQTALTAAEEASPLARRPYDLRHACLSTWLNGGVYPTQVADWAGHSAEVLLRTYAKCVAGQDELAKRRISEALRQD
jgi:integrase